jgi:hypothetical protein
MKRNLALVGLVLMLACQETPMEPNSNDSGLAGSGAQVDKILHARFPISNSLTDHTQGDRFSDVFQFRIVRISKGGAENSAGWIKFHLTIDDGVVKIIKDDAAFDVCRG